MNDEHEYARPRTAQTPRRRRPAFAQAHDAIDLPPLDQIAPTLDAPWRKQATDTPERTAAYTHPEGHHIGLRIQPGGLTIQTWITAGPDLPPIPNGTPEEQAETQAANDARLQPGRTWHTPLATRRTTNLTEALEAVVRDQLLPALTGKPKHVAATTPHRDAEPQPEPTQNTPQATTAPAITTKGTRT